MPSAAARLRTMTLLRLGDSHGHWYVCGTARVLTGQAVHWFKSDDPWPGRAHDPNEPSACHDYTTEHRAVGGGSYADDRNIQQNMRPGHLCAPCCLSFLAMMDGEQ